MTRLTDGTRSANIIIHVWDEESSQYTPDFSADFYGIGGAEMIECPDGEVAFKCQNLDYALEQADDWKNGVGDYREDRDAAEDMGIEFNPDNRCVEVEFI